jgi:hypothetical protein
MFITNIYVEYISFLEKVKKINIGFNGNLTYKENNQTNFDFDVFINNVNFKDNYHSIQVVKGYYKLYLEEIDNNLELELKNTSETIKIVFKNIQKDDIQLVCDGLKF